MRPLAQHLGVKWLIANRLSFRDGIATGRLLEPVVRPRSLFAGISGSGPDGRRAPERLARDLGLPDTEVLESAVITAARQLSAESGRLFIRRSAPPGSAVDPAGDGREARLADRRDRIYWEGVAGQ